MVCPVKMKWFCLHVREKICSNFRKSRPAKDVKLIYLRARFKNYYSKERLWLLGSMKQFSFWELKCDTTAVDSSLTKVLGLIKSSAMFERMA